MPPELPESGSARDWLRHANSDLHLSRSRPPQVLREALAFHAQQASEKAIKAVLVHLNIEFPKTHSLVVLSDLLPGEIVKPMHTEVRSLTDYAVTTRYPGEWEPVSEEELVQATALAQQVVEWAETVLTSDNSAK